MLYAKINVKSNHFLFLTSLESPLNKGGSEGVWKYRWLHVVDSKKEGFQVILVEHAPKSYWEGENGFSYFKTCHQFLDGEALIPSRIIKKYTKND